eukprot:361929-Chlamydomonas_euryale.AAC.2
MIVMLAAEDAEVIVPSEAVAVTATARYRGRMPARLAFGQGLVPCQPVGFASCSHTHVQYACHDQATREGPGAYATWSAASNLGSHNASMSKE